MIANELWLCVYITYHADNKRIIAITTYLISIIYITVELNFFLSKNQLSRE